MAALEGNPTEGLLDDVRIPVFNGRNLHHQIKAVFDIMRALPNQDDAVHLLHQLEAVFGE